MASNQDLINLLEERIARLRKARAIATDEAVKFKLEQDIRESEEQLAQFGGSADPTAASSSPSYVPPSPGAPAPSPSPKTPPPANEIPPTSASAPPWWMITAGATVATFLLAWWMLTDAKIAALIALAVGLWLLFRNPELIYQRLALTAMGLVVVLNAINFSGFLDGRVGENEFRLELTEPSIIVSLGLLVFAGYMMYLHSQRKA